MEYDFIRRATVAGPARAWNTLAGERVAGGLDPVTLRLTLEACATGTGGDGCTVKGAATAVEGAATGGVPLEVAGGAERAG